MDWILVALLVLALLLRLRGVLSFPLEGDEMYTFFEARNLFGTALEPGVEARPLYFLLQHGLAVLTPDWLVADRHPAVLRALPVVFGVAGVWTIWKLGKEAMGRRAALVAAALTAISPWHLYASGMARYWSLVFLLACLAYWRLLVAHRTDSLRDHLIAAVPTVLGAVTHPTFLFPMVGGLLALRIEEREDAPWPSWSWPSSSEWKGFWLPVVGSLGIAGLALVLTGSEDAVRNWGGRDLAAVLRLLPAMVQWATPVVVAAGVLGMVAAFWSDPTDTRIRAWGRLAVAGTAASIVLLLLASLGTNVYADYGISALPLILVSAGILVSRLVGGLGRLSPVAALFAFLVLGAGMAPATGSHLLNGTRFDYRVAFEVVRREAPDLPVFVSPIVQQRWYAPELKGRELVTRPDWLERALPREGAWVIVPVRRYGIVGDSDHRFRRWLSSHCSLHLLHDPLRFDYREYHVEVQRCFRS